ncbi:metalloendopeptidase [Malassezia vespertilionis]|nr:metalloendopeptidase [Malassezia vespertilionis]WFD07548.1 metalloendopeptidase [Malassezia vespertilionis]
MDVNMRDELAVGKDAYQQTMQTYAGKMLPPRSPAVTQVQRVVSRIAAAAAELDKNRAPDAPPTKWTVHVIRDPQKNAFVLPGGNIFVFTGILPVCKNDDGLATVLSHEISHQLARHSAEKMSGYKVLMIGTFLLDILGIDIGLSQIGLNLLLTLPNSRTMETEADTLGLRIMAQACFNPREAIEYVAFAKHTDQQFLETHGFRRGRA